MKNKFSPSTTSLSFNLFSVSSKKFYFHFYNGFQIKKGLPVTNWNFPYVWISYSADLNEFSAMQTFPITF